MLSVAQTTEDTQVVLGGQQVRGRICTSIHRCTSHSGGTGDWKEPIPAIPQHLIPNPSGNSMQDGEQDDVETLTKWAGASRGNGCWALLPCTPSGSTLQSGTLADGLQIEL